MAKKWFVSSSECPCDARSYILWYVYQLIWFWISYTIRIIVYLHWKICFEINCLLERCMAKCSPSWPVLSRDKVELLDWYTSYFVGVVPLLPVLPDKLSVLLLAPFWSEPDVFPLPLIKSITPRPIVPSPMEIQNFEWRYCWLQKMHHRGPIRTLY